MLRDNSRRELHLVTDHERNQLAKAWITLQTTPQHAPEYNSLFWAFDKATISPAKSQWKHGGSSSPSGRSINPHPRRKVSPPASSKSFFCFHGEFMIQHIERQAKADRSFATLLGAVRQNTMPDEVWNRLQDVWIAADGALFLHHVGIKQREKLPTREVVESALVEFAKLAALLLCMLSLYAIFRTLFLSVEDPQPILQPPQVLTNRILDALLLLSLSAAISLLGGIIFREAEPDPHPSLASTLPLQIFSWATSIMIVLFFLAWFLETHYIFSPIKHW